MPQSLRLFMHVSFQMRRMCCRLTVGTASINVKDGAVVGQRGEVLLQVLFQTIQISLCMQDEVIFCKILSEVGNRCHPSDLHLLYGIISDLLVGQDRTVHKSPRAPRAYQ